MRPYPVHIELELTNRCNLNCIMCPHGIMKRAKGDMSITTFCNVIDKLAGKSKTSYLHQIGEPLLNPDMIEMIDYMKDTGIRSSISTNCMLLDKEMTHRILESDLGEIVLCLDSIDKTKYETIRRGGDFDRVISNILYFIKEKSKIKSDMYCQVQLIKMKENNTEWDNFKQHFEKLGVDNVWIKDYSTFAGYVTKGETIAARRFHCSKMFTHMTIHWNGDAVACCRDFEGWSKMGNVNNQSVRSIWLSEKYDDFRRLYKQTKLCKDC